MTKTKDFVSAIPQAASPSDESKQRRHTLYVQEKKIKEKYSQENVKSEELSSQDFEDSGTLVFTTFDALPENKVDFDDNIYFFEN